MPYVDASGVLYLQQSGTNVYFAGKLVRSNDQGIATDRLGSVIATLPDPPTGVFPYGAASLTYFPHGEERQTTTQNREKFATYYRDGSGLDYADQRYYASNYGRFLTPDPYRATTVVVNDPSNPGSWNRYAYVQGDLVNFYDPLGENMAQPDGAFCSDGPLDMWGGCRRGGGGGATLPGEIWSKYWNGEDWVPYRVSSWGTDQVSAENTPLLAANTGGPSGGATGGRNSDGDMGSPADKAHEKERQNTSTIGTIANCLGSAVVNHYGAGVATAISGALAVPIPKGSVPPYRVIGTETTNILSVIGYYVQISIPRIESLRTANLFRAAGRFNPWILGALTAYDAAVLTVDTYKCYDQRTQGAPLTP